MLSGQKHPSREKASCSASYLVTGTPCEVKLVEAIMLRVRHMTDTSREN